MTEECKVRIMLIGNTLECAHPRKLQTRQGVDIRQGTQMMIVNRSFPVVPAGRFTASVVVNSSDMSVKS